MPTTSESDGAEAGSVYSPSDDEDEDDGDCSPASGAAAPRRRGPSIPEAAGRSRLKLCTLPADSKTYGKFLRSLPAAVKEADPGAHKRAADFVAQAVACAVSVATGQPPQQPSGRDVDARIGELFSTVVLDRLTAHFDGSGCTGHTVERYLAALESTGIIEFLVAERLASPDAAKTVAKLKRLYCKRGVLEAKQRREPLRRLEAGFAPDHKVLGQYVLARMTGPGGIVAAMLEHLAAAPDAPLTAAQFLQTSAAFYAVLGLACPAMRPGVWGALTVTQLLADLAYDLAEIKAGIVDKGDYTAAELAGLATVVFGYEGNKTARIYGVSSIAVSAELAALMRLFVRFRAKALRDSFGVEAPTDYVFVNSAGGALTNLATHTRAFTEAASEFTNPATGAPFPKMNVPPNGFRAVQTTAEARASAAIPDSARAALVAATQNHTKAVAMSPAYTLIHPRERALRDAAALERAGVDYLRGYLTPDQIAQFSA